MNNYQKDNDEQFNKTIRNMIIAKELKNNIDQTNLSYEELSPKTRIKVGDVEINDPEMFYRQGIDIMGKDFIATGVVNRGKVCTNPMFSRGSIFYGLNAVKARKNVLKKRKGKFLLIDSKIEPKSYLITTKAEMIPADSGSHPLKEIIEEKEMEPFTTKEYRIFPEMKDFMDKYNEYCDRERRKQFNKVKRITPELIRTIPKEELNTSNSILYKYQYGYGYKKVQQEPSTFYLPIKNNNLTNINF